MDGRNIFIKKTTRWDYLYATIFSIAVGFMLAFVYLYRIGELPCLR
jgi:hypothetical protein